MPLTPDDIQNVAFEKPSRGKRGYDEDEVDVFLDHVARDMAKLLDEKAWLETQLQELHSSQTVVAYPPQDPIDVPTEMLVGHRLDISAGSSIQAQPLPEPPQALRVLEMAERTAEEHVAAATAEAVRVVAEAEESAAEIVAVARESASVLEKNAQLRYEAEVGGLEEQRTVLEGHLSELKGFEQRYRTSLRDYLTDQLAELNCPVSDPNPL